MSRTQRAAHNKQPRQWRGWAFIWKVVTTPNNPATPENNEEVAFCFAYGEEQWLEGTKWEDRKNDVAYGLEDSTACP